MTNQYTTTTEHILALHKEGIDSYNIVVVISDDWDMSTMRASIMVDYTLKNELYKEVEPEVKQ